MKYSNNNIYACMQTNTDNTLLKVSSFEAWWFDMCYVIIMQTTESRVEQRFIYGIDGLCQSNAAVIQLEHWKNNV